LITRRQILKGIAAAGVGSMSLGGYALAEPFRLRVKRYGISPPDWPKDLDLRVAVIADLHACEPWMPVERIRQIVARTNALSPDVVLLLGDYVLGMSRRLAGKPVPHAAWAGALGALKAPLGVHAVLGNHDWWDDPEVQKRRSGPIKAQTVLEDVGIKVYQNEALRVAKNGQPLWLAGLGDQWAFWATAAEWSEIRPQGRMYVGVDDLSGTLAKVTDDAPVILMAHEPDIFPEVPARVALTVSGHTHGGQVRIAGYAPRVPSRYGQRYVYGHIVEEGRNLVVSAGLGCSTLPIRFGAPPEIVMVELAAHADFA
jgi:hypothetical protein